MSQVRPKTERVGEIAAKVVVQLLFATGRSFTVDGLREKLREFYREEVRPELRAVAALNNVELKYLTHFLQPAARPCRSSVTDSQWGGFAPDYRSPKQGTGCVSERTGHCCERKS